MTAENKNRITVGIPTKRDVDEAARIEFTYTTVEEYPNLYDICKLYGIELIDVALPEHISYIEANGKDTYLNNSYCSTKTIWLGIYDNPEKRLFSFFHELGHLIGPTPSYLSCGKMAMELLCWSFGLQYAASLGIRFSDSTLAWGYERALACKGL
jgi:hypothetical protein